MRHLFFYYIWERRRLGIAAAGVLETISRSDHKTNVNALSSAVILAVSSKTGTVCVFLCSSNCCKSNHLARIKVNSEPTRHISFDRWISASGQGKSRVLVVPQVTLVRAPWCCSKRMGGSTSPPYTNRCCRYALLKYIYTVEGNTYKPTTINHSLALGERMRSSREQWSQVPINNYGNEIFKPDYSVDDDFRRRQFD